MYIQYTFTICDLWHISEIKKGGGWSKYLSWKKLLPPNPFSSSWSSPDIIFNIIILILSTGGGYGIPRDKINSIYLFIKREYQERYMWEGVCVGMDRFVLKTLTNINDDPLLRTLTTFKRSENFGKFEVRKHSGYLSR